MYHNYLINKTYTLGISGKKKEELDYKYSTNTEREQYESYLKKTSTQIYSLN